MVSQKFKFAVKTSETKCYRLAHEAGLHPSTLSQILHDIVKVKENGSRVLKVGKVLGLKPEDCFQRK